MATYLDHSEQYPHGIRKKSEYQEYNKKKITIEEFKAQNSLFGLYFLEGYKIIKGFIKSKEKQKEVKLSYTKFQPQNKIGTICIVHGYAQTSNDYLQIADYFAKSKFIVHIVDLRGYGFSGGSRLHQSLSQIYYDIQALLQCCQPNLPCFILSHGIGAVLVVNLLIQNPKLPIAGILILNPTFSFPNSPENLMAKSVKSLTNAFLGDLLISTNISPTSFSKMNETIKNKIISGVNYQYVTLRIKQQLESTSSYVIKNSRNFCYPIIIFAGSLSSIQPLNFTQQFFLEIGSQDKTLRRFAEGYHSLHLDYQSELLKKEAMNWITGRMQISTFSVIPPLKMGKMASSKINKSTILIFILIIYGLFKYLKR